MATYAYDDFSVEFVARPDGRYDLTALSPDGVTHRSTFEVPMSMNELQDAVVAVARERSRTAEVLESGPESLRPAGFDADATPVDGEVMPGEAVSREVAAALVASASDDADGVGAEQLGAALAGALFDDGLGAVYETARGVSAREQRGLRLTLTLDQAPALMSLPWEFLYRRPRFIASQRHTPLVRCLRVGELPAPPKITQTVRILGVVSSPLDLPQLDVAAERGHVELAVADMVEAGRVELDWLEPATPGRLREVLRDDDYHIIHYVGHSSFAEGDEGTIFLENERRDAHAVDGTLLANLLSDQGSLRLVVLNSCEGARTTLSDPYAGVATTLMHLGVPAVVAMQFEITDRAAIKFANELYTNLIGRQDPIDASVSEARKAILIEIDRVEWATPVLFVRDPNVRLFDFRLPEVQLPPPPAQNLARDAAEVPATDTTGAEPGTSDTGTSDTGGQPPPPRTDPPPPAGRTTQGDSNRRPLLPLVIGLSLVIILVGGGLIWMALSAPSDDPPEPTTPTTIERQGPQPRERTGHLSVQIRESDGDVHLYPVDVDTLENVGDITDRSGAFDSQGVWAFDNNRVAFVRERPADGEGQGIFYVVPGDFVDDRGKQVAPLIPWTPGQHHTHPAWTTDGALFYLAAASCRPGPGCVQSLRHATFEESVDSSGFRDVLTLVRDDDAGSRFESVSAISADPQTGDRVALVDGSGLWLADSAGDSELLASGVQSDSIAFVASGRFIVALEQLDNTQLLTVYDVSTGQRVRSETLTVEGDPRRFTSLTADLSNDEIVVLSIVGDDAGSARVTRFSVAADGAIAAIEERQLNVADIGTAQAIAL